MTDFPPCHDDPAPPAQEIEVEQEHVEYDTDWRGPERRPGWHLLLAFLAGGLTLKVLEMIW